MANIEEVIVSGGNKWSKLKPLDVSKVEKEKFPKEKVYHIIKDKKQIVLHHTVSNPTSARGDIKWWNRNMQHVATCIIITADGVPHQLFSSKYWSHHLGIPSKFMKALGFSDYKTRNVKLNEESISIEIDNWGGLEKIKDGVYRNVYKMDLDIPEEDIEYFPEGFRGYKYYQKYTDEQIKTVGELLLLWNKRYGIPLDYNEDMWDISKDAISGKPGVWSHVSYRSHGDKQDCFPQPELKAMIRTISGIV